MKKLLATISEDQAIPEYAISAYTRAISERGAPEDAISAYTRAISELGAPEDAISAYTRAISELGAPEDAVNAYSRAISELGPEYAITACTRVISELGAPVEVFSALGAWRTSLPRQSFVCNWNKSLPRQASAMPSNIMRAPSGQLFARVEPQIATQNQFATSEHVFRKHVFASARHRRFISPIPIVEHSATDSPPSECMSGSNSRDLQMFTRDVIASRNFCESLYSNMFTYADDDTAEPVDTSPLRSEAFLQEERVGVGECEGALETLRNYIHSLHWVYERYGLEGIECGIAELDWMASQPGEMLGIADEDNISDEGSASECEYLTDEISSNISDEVSMSEQEHETNSIVSSTSEQSRVSKHEHATGSITSNMSDEDRTLEHEEAAASVSGFVASRGSDDDIDKRFMKHMSDEDRTLELEESAASVSGLVASSDSAYDIDTRFMKQLRRKRILLTRYQREYQEVASKILDFRPYARRVLPCSQERSKQRSPCPAQSTFISYRMPSRCKATPPCSAQVSSVRHLSRADVSPIIETKDTILDRSPLPMIATLSHGRSVSPMHVFHSSYRRVATLNTTVQCMQHKSLATRPPLFVRQPQAHISHSCQVGFVHAGGVNFVQGNCRSFYELSIVQAGDIRQHPSLIRRSPFVGRSRHSAIEEPLNSCAHALWKPSTLLDRSKQAISTSTILKVSVDNQNCIGQTTTRMNRVSATTATYAAGP